MKRMILWLLALMLAAGCAANPPAAGEGSAAAILTKPPALTVRVGENEGTAALSTYSWDWPNSDGTRSGVEADGLHPLDMLEYVTPIFLNDEGTVELRFEGAAKPDHLTIRRWDRSCAGDPSKYESNYDMLSCTMEGDTLTAALPDGLGGIFALLILLGIFNGGFGGFGGNNGVNTLNADMQRGCDLFRASRPAVHLFLQRLQERSAVECDCENGFVGLQGTHKCRRGIDFREQPRLRQLHATTRLD